MSAIVRMQRDVRRISVPFLLILFSLVFSLLFSVSPSQMQTLINTPGACPGAMVSQLVIGAQAQVNPGEPNNVRAEPSIDAEQLFQIPAGGVMDVLDGPVCADGYAWWLISYEDQTGWTVEGTDTEYFLDYLPSTDDVTPDTTLTLTDPACQPQAAIRPQLQVGQTAHLRYPYPHRVFEEPSDTSAALGQIESEETIHVLAGPVCGDYGGRSVWWFEVRTDSITGWVIEYDDGTYVIEVGTPGPTPTPLFEPLPQVHTLDWSSDGRTLAAGTSDGLYLFDADDFSKPPRQLFPRSYVMSVAFHPTEPTVLALHVDAYAADIAPVLQVINSETGEVFDSVELSSASVGSYFSAQPRKLDFSADGDQLLDRWNVFGEIYQVEGLESSGSINIPREQGSSVTTLSPDGQWMATNYGLDHLYVGSVDGRFDGQELADMSFSEEITGLYFSPDSTALIILDQCGSLFHLSIPEAELITDEVADCEHVRPTALDFARQRPVFYTSTGREDAAVEIYQTDDLTLLDTLTISDAPSGPLPVLAVNPDDTLLAVSVTEETGVPGEAYSTVTIMDIETKSPVTRLVLRHN